MRYIAFSIIILAGASCLGLASTSNSARYGDAASTGVALIIAGAVGFLIDYYRDGWSRPKS